MSVLYSGSRRRPRLPGGATPRYKGNRGAVLVPKVQRPRRPPLRVGVEKLGSGREGSACTTRRFGYLRSTPPPRRAGRLPHVRVLRWKVNLRWGWGEQHKHSVGSGSFGGFDDA